MKTKTLNRKPASIAKRRWAAYATAGAASAFTCASSAEVAIHYSGIIHRVFTWEDTATFPLDQPGDFIRLRHHTGTGYAGYNYFSVAGRLGASNAGFYAPDCTWLSPVWASKLDLGQLISRRQFVPVQSALLAFRSLCGEFNHRGLGYIGFKFNNGSGDQYGWVRIYVRRTFYDTFILEDYAYGDVGDRVRAGQTSSNEMVPEEGSLGWLALGAAGLLAWRKRRSRTAR
jgi:hypothetical protein